MKIGQKHSWKKVWVSQSITRVTMQTPNTTATETNGAKQKERMYIDPSTAKKEPVKSKKVNQTMKALGINDHDGDEK